MSPRDRKGSRSSQGWGSGRDSDDDDGLFRRGARGSRTENNWSRASRNNDNDWLIGGRRSSRASSRDRYIYLLMQIFQVFLKHFCPLLEHVEFM